MFTSVRMQLSTTWNLSSWNSTGNRCLTLATELRYHSRPMRQFLFALLLVAACDRPKEPDARQVASRALQGALSYPGSTIVKINAGTDAAEVTLTTRDSVPAVALWFRQALTLNGWQLRNEGKGAGGAVSIYAEKPDGRPLWVTLRPNTGGPGTTYTLIGAIIEPDSAAARTPRQ